MGMKPPANEGQIKIKGSVSSAKSRDANAPIKGAASRTAAKKDAPIKGSVQRRRFGKPA